MKEKLVSVKIVLMDVDGVLTDGTLYYGEKGEHIKGFNVHDGAGIVYLNRAGYITGIITAKDSLQVKRRAEDLGIKQVYTGITDKKAAFMEILQNTDLHPNQAAYIGDDLSDIPVLNMCGVSFAPCDAVEEVCSVCDIVCEHCGGRGAVRETAERIMKASGTWENILSQYT